MDVILQMHNQSYAHRVCLLAQNPTVLILPGGEFGESAEELGPKKSMHHGPNLVMLRNCTASKAEIIDHIHTTFLRRYVARIYWCHGTAPTKEAVAAQVAEELCQLMSSSAATNSETLTQKLSMVDFASTEDEQVHRGSSYGFVRTEGCELESEDKSEVGVVEKVDSRKAAVGPFESGRIEESLPVNDTQFEVGSISDDSSEPKGAEESDSTQGNAQTQPSEPVKSANKDSANVNGHVAGVGSRVAGGNGHVGGVNRHVEAKNGHVDGFSSHVAGVGRKIRLRIQACPKSLEDFFTDSLPDVDVGMARFTHVLGIAEVHAPHYGNSATKRWVYHYGISPANEVYFQRDLRGGVGLAGRGTGDLQCLHEGSVSKAVCKMEEVLEAVGWPLGKESTVIDLGAAPGAWTAYLARHVARVVAVDPAEMGADAMLDNVTHIRKAWLAHFRWQAIDARDDVAAWQKDQLSDLLVCDINKHPKEVLKWAEPLYPFLRPGGLFIMTLKFFGKARDKSEALSILTPMLEKHFVDMDCIWLLANTVHERTLVARKR